MVDRKKAVWALVDNDIDTFIASYNDMGDCSTLAFILESGFKGYNNFTDEELMREFMWAKLKAQPLANYT